MWFVTKPSTWKRSDLVSRRVREGRGVSCSEPTILMRDHHQLTFFTTARPGELWRLRKELAQVDGVLDDFAMLVPLAAARDPSGAARRSRWPQSVWSTCHTAISGPTGCSCGRSR